MTVVVQVKENSPKNSDKAVSKQSLKKSKKKGAYCILGAEGKS